MKPQLLDPETFTVKVISIDRNSVSQKLLNLLEGRQTYTDNQIGEHLYGCMLGEDISQKRPITTELQEELSSITELCNQNDASYFRIVEL